MGFPMEKIINWIIHHKKITIILLLLMIFGPMILIHILYKIHLNCYWIESDWTSGELLGYYGNVLSFIGTIVLGYIAIMQTENANKINGEFLEIEKNRIKPCLNISTSKLYKIYLENHIEEMNRICINEAIILNLLFPKEPRTGCIDHRALIELEVYNSGGSGIKNITIKDIFFYISASDPFNCNGNMISFIGGNTNLPVQERKKLYIDIKREISFDGELRNTWYQDNIEKIMPYMEIEFILETITGDIYREKIICESFFDQNMQNNGNIITRAIGISDLCVEKYHS